MQFISITEYFYKFYSSLLLIVLIPILVFTGLYLQPSPIREAIQTRDIFIVPSSVIVIFWILAIFFFNKKIKTIRNGQGLRRKLERYHQLTIVRYSFFMLTGLMLAFAYYFLRTDVFTSLFVFQLIFLGFTWPTSSKVCADLKLRGDEREMVYYKKDVL
jgi:hypothetical protein